MLEINLNENENEALYLQLYKKLRNKIKIELEANTKLPPIRKLAAEVEVNPATVVKAYDMLAEEGLIYKKVGSGSFVAPVKKTGFLEESVDMLKHGQIKLSESINFASAAPSTDLFPVADFKYAINQVLERDQGEAFSYQKSQGFLPLRKSIRKYFSSQGINSSLDQIQVVSGAQQAIDIISKILLDYRDQIIVEDPTYFGALQAFNSRKADIKSIKMEQDGADLEEMESYLQQNKIKFFFTMQNFQNPTGVNWSQQKQLQLLELAEEYDFYIIEDDILSDLYYDQSKVSTLKKFDKQGRVIYIKSFSKVFMPGLRLAFIVLPERLLP
ncbi:MAG: PLP-dependent aminotransferase family protein, partial [Halanaerobium sp.]